MSKLPSHLQEKIQELAWCRAMDECRKLGVSPSSTLYESVKAQFMSDAIQIYSLLLQELGPVVEALRNYDYDSNGKPAREALKHLKERILNGNNT